MKVFKVLGSGCRNCVKTAELIEQMAQQKGLNVKVEKVTDLERIMEYQVMSTPGVVMDEQVVHSGGVPKAEQVQAWLSN